ncbi:hypothetical protein V9T40_014296 [Parthenolecanium corni]|uniref:Uncharacterized protein n=1 Tax=Parthenolecanium corni TaxID=536013 RepID=A0AAN9T313_9HEMI
MLQLSAVIHFLWIAFAYGVYAPSTIAPYIASPTPAIASHYQSVVRSLDGNSVISTYGKAVETPHSSVRKYDSRISNDALFYSHYPAVSAYPHYPVAPTLYPKPAPYLTIKPTHLYSAPTYVAHHSSYPSAYLHPSPIYPASPYPPPAQYAINPYLKHLPGHDGVLPYSDATHVSHISFEGLGANYAW